MQNSGLKQVRSDAYEPPRLCRKMPPSCNPALGSSRGFSGTSRGRIDRLFFEQGGLLQPARIDWRPPADLPRADASGRNPFDKREVDILAKALEEHGDAFVEVREAPHRVA